MLDTEDRPQTVRIVPDADTMLNQLGFLRDFPGTWVGDGFNLIGRPDAQGKTNVYLQLNKTREQLKVVPIGSSIPNRGFGQKDIELFGLTYEQKISDLHTGGAMHIEPGIWVTQPRTTYPPEAGTAHQQLVARMGSIPHGNALLAQGIAEQFLGAPTLKQPSGLYAHSVFPSFNSTPFATLPVAPPAINADGTSEALNAKAGGVPPFQQYDLSVPFGPANPRTPFGTHPADPPLPIDLNGVPMQDVVNDPIRLLQATIDQQVRDGCHFEGVAINIATQSQITFKDVANDAPTGARTVIDVGNGGGGIENIPFLLGGTPVGPVGPNANAALVYATFWITKVTHPQRQTFLQLQYAQTVILNFPIFTALPRVVPIGWPHVSVATLRKTFS